MRRPPRSTRTDTLFPDTTLFRSLLPHLNAGLMDAAQLARLRRVAPSMGIMLESTSQRLCERGGPHFGSPDKQPARRLVTLRLACEARIPMTSGILVGLGEARREGIDSLLPPRALSSEEHNA